jgi:hypothetical protein
VTLAPTAPAPVRAEWVWHRTAAKRLGVTILEVIDLIRCGRLVGEMGRHSLKGHDQGVGFWVRHDSLIDLEAEWRDDPPPLEPDLHKPRPATRTTGGPWGEREGGRYKVDLPAAYTKPVLYGLLTLADVAELHRRRERMADAGYRFRTLFPECETC